MKKLQLTIIALVIFPFFAIQAQTIFPVPKYPYETCIVDYDLDGDNDIVVGSNWNFEDDSIVFFINDGWGNFEQQQFAANGGGFLYCVDLTGDNYPDIITRDADSIFFYENTQTIGIGTGYIIRNTYGNPYIGGIADINLDGTNDILFYEITVPWGWGVAFNSGDNTFTDSLFLASNETLQMAHSGNLNNDNNPDILMTTLDQSKSVRVLYNYYPGFTEQVIATHDWNRSYVLNVNNDNLNDILLARLLYDGSTWIVNMLNEIDYFQACDTLIFVNGTAIKNICDYNQDGYDDLSMTVYQANNQPIEDSVYIYFNDHECGYTHAQSIYMGDYYWLPTINSGDLNGDGYPELVVQGFSMPSPDYIRILWNDGTGHFIDTNSVYVRQEEYWLKQQVTVFPNPVENKLTINTSLFNRNTPFIITLYNMQGRKIFSKQAISSTGSYQLDVSGINPGMYIIELSSNEYKTSGKLVKK